MNVIVEKRPIVGTLKTLLGTYSLLEWYPEKFRENSSSMASAGALSFYVVDDEGFENRAIVKGDFIVIRSKIIEIRDVKRILTVEEEPLYRDELLTERKLDELSALDLETATNE